MDTYASPFVLRYSLRTGNGILDHGHLQLLRSVRQRGSIAGAADAVGVSYKTAWTWLDAMNSAAQGALVESTHGGASGGGSRLTALGDQILDQFENLQRRHQEFLESFQGHDRDQLHDMEAFLERLALRTSPRNQLQGTIERIWGNQVEAWIDIAVTSLPRITARVARSTVEDLSLEVGQGIAALIKATCVQVICDGRIPVSRSPTNSLPARLIQATLDETTVQATLDIGAGHALTALVSSSHWAQVSPKENAPLFACFSPDHVMLALRP